jgi:hypothetical protein
MPSRKTRNARQSANDTPITYPIQLSPEFDSPSPAIPVVDLPEFDAAQPPSPAPPPELERAEELDLLDMHGTSARVSGDRNTPSPLVPVFPPAVTLRSRRNLHCSMLEIRSKRGMFDHPSLLGESPWLSHSSLYDRRTLCALVKCAVATRGETRNKKSRFGDGFEFSEHAASGAAEDESEYEL